MEHTKARRVLTALVGAGVLFVSGCGSAEDGSGSSAPSSAAAAPSTSPAAAASSGTESPTGGATGGSTPASSADVSSAPVSDPTSPGDSTSGTSSDAAPSSPSTATTDSSSPASEGEGVSVTDAAGLTGLAQQLGCTAPKVQAAKPGSEGAKAGATAVAQCTLDGTQYLLAANKNPAGVPALIKSFSSAIAGGKKVYYVVGPTWFALGSKTGDDAPEDIAKAIQAKIGGEVSSTD